MGLGPVSCQGLTSSKRLSDTAAYSNFGANTQVPNQVHYGEVRIPTCLLF